MEFASPLEIVAHRVIWTFALLWLLLLLRGQFAALKNLTIRQWLLLAGSGALIGVNWGVFVWALQNGRIVEAALGYYINPLVSIFLGALFLRETLRPWQVIALILALVGVGNELWHVGYLPWVALTLAFSFGFYGLVRKQAQVDSTVGLLVETSLMLPLALIGLYWLSAAEPSHRNLLQLGLLALGGPVTMFPLLCFAAAANRLSLTTLGFIQYLAPTITLLLAIYVYHEPVTSERWVSLIAIWVGLVLFSVEGLYVWKKDWQKDWKKS